MSFPDIHAFPKGYPGPYERQMGESIAALLRLFAGRTPDAESNARVLELASCPDRWSAGHAVFDEVRRRLLADMKEKNEPREWQHSFEETCCQALYNASEPPDPFDPSSAYFVSPTALGLAHALGIPMSEAVNVLIPGVKKG